MKYYYYVHTGHRIGLERFRRASAIIKALPELEITLLSSDFRIASEAKEYGITKAVGVDVVRNIPQIAHYGDKIIFDSEEFNDFLLADMTQFFSTFIRITESDNDTQRDGEILIKSTTENGAIIDEKYFTQSSKTIERVFFFGDDDYEKDLEKNMEIFKDLNFSLLEGFYYFLGYTDGMKEIFENIYENEEYDEVITAAKVLVTSSPQAVLNSLASGGKPIYFQRADYSDHYLKLFISLNIPILDELNKYKLELLLENIESHKYHNVSNSTDIVANVIKKHSS